MLKFASDALDGVKEVIESKPFPTPCVAMASV